MVMFGLIDVHLLWHAQMHDFIPGSIELSIANEKKVVHLGSFMNLSFAIEAF